MSACGKRCSSSEQKAPAQASRSGNDRCGRDRPCSQAAPSRAAKTPASFVHPGIFRASQAYPRHWPVPQRGFQERLPPLPPACLISPVLGQVVHGFQSEKQMRLALIRLQDIAYGIKVCAGAQFRRRLFDEKGDLRTGRKRVEHLNAAGRVALFTAFFLPRRRRRSCRKVRL